MQDKKQSERNEEELGGVCQSGFREERKESDPGEVTNGEEE
jgi:hypothetical protein